LEPLKKIHQGKAKTITWKRLTMDDIYSPPKWSQYVTFTAHDGEHLPSDITIYRNLKSLLGTENPAFSVDNNKLIVKAANEDQSKVLLRTKAIGSREVFATDRTQFNTRSGTMILDRLRLDEYESEEFICNAIKEILSGQKQCCVHLII